MNRLVKYFIISLCAIALAFKVFAQSIDKVDHTLVKAIYIHGKIEGEAKLVTKTRLSVIKDDRDNLIEFNGAAFDVFPGQHGTFDFELPIIDRPAKILQIVIYYDHGHDVLNNYVVESGDSISIILKIAIDTS